MSLNPSFLSELDNAIKLQSSERTLESGMRTALAVLSLLGAKPAAEVEDIQLTKMQLPNAERYDHWFQPHPFFKSNRSCFELIDSDTVPLQAKFYWLQKNSKLAISGGVHFSPNWEDSEFTRTEGYKVGIDFFLTSDGSSLLVVLSDRGNLRIVELNERLRSTQVEIFSAWIEIGKAVTPEILHPLLWKTFQLQAVNEKFYVGIANAFTELVHHFEKNVPELNESDSKQFVNRLIGRLLFCWFLRKREILDKDQTYFDSGSIDSENYYYSRLEPLFFLTLNTPIAERAKAFDVFIKNSSSYIDKESLQNLMVDLTTPYLNGGLFDAHDNDYFGTNIVSFPQGFFVRLFEHFNSYNFTTDESSPEYEQVAIDPEMLGKVFESLLATQMDDTGAQARQAVGAFYTPRAIVNNMCKESLRVVLKDKLGDSETFHTAVDALLDTPDNLWASVGSNSRRDFLKGKGEGISEALDEISVFDPACGSGAFPLGMLQLFVKCHERINPSLSSYDLKLRVLSHNIYGSDIEPMAIEISKLRAWLSLVVQDDVAREIHPLPNLDFHFVCANSLIELESETLEFTLTPTEALNAIRNKYFAETNPAKKRKLQDEYFAITDSKTGHESPRAVQIMSFDPFKSSKPAAFFDKYQMFGLTEGFDVVIGNPPYVRHEKVSYKKNLSSFKVYAHTADLYTYFYELALNNLKSKGVLSFITSSKFGRTQYGLNVRKMLAQKTRINYLLDFGSEHVFKAITNTWILQATKEAPEGNIFPIFDGNFQKSSEFEQKDLSEASWSFLDDSESEIFEKMASTSVLFGDSKNSIYRGIGTGCNEAYVLDDELRLDLISRDPKNEELIKHALKGRDIWRYEQPTAKKWLLAAKDGIDIEKEYPTIASYLRDCDKRLNGKVSTRWDIGATWLNLRPCDYYNLFETEKIVFQRISAVNNFTLSTKGEYLMNTVFMIHSEDPLLMLGVLNSKAILFYMNKIASSTGMATIEWTKFAVDQLPIPLLSKENEEICEEIRKLVSKRLAQKSSDKAPSSELEARIDELVFQLFQLNVADVLVIQSRLESVEK